MALYASVNENRVVTLALTISYYGTWVADVQLADATDIGTAVTLTVANLSLVGTIVRQATFAGNRSARIVGGAAGWRKVLTARSYHLPGGIPIAIVLNDAAVEIGEKLTGVPAGTIGVYFVREAPPAPASRLLRQVVGRAWWIDAAGVTHIGARPTTTVASAFQVANYNGAHGAYQIATEDLAAWQPGAQFSNALIPTVATVSSMTVHAEKKGKLRIEVLAA